MFARVLVESPRSPRLFESLIDRAFESGAAAALLGPTVAVVGGGIGTVLVVGFVAWKWRSLSKLRSLEELSTQHSTLHPAG